MSKTYEQKANQVKLLKVLILILLTSCSSLKNNSQKEISKIIDAQFFENQFTGFLLFDPQKNDTIYEYNSQKYFTPASNTKIFTLFTALQTLPDSIPALKYLVKNDTLYVQGTGDPSSLHPYFKDSTIINFLNGFKNISVYLRNFEDEKFGPGWAWDDYDQYYQPERGSFPLYGNVISIFNEPKRTVLPDYFKDSVVDLDFRINREAEKNIFYFSESRRDTVEIPFRTDSIRTRKLLEKLLNKKVSIAKKMPEGKKYQLFSVATDTVLQRMMYISDNFLAEQLMILSSSMLSDTLSFAKAREHILGSELQDLSEPPRWVDGSGLSRYNLFSPKSMVQVLSKMYLEVNRERLLHFFPSNGINGTIDLQYGTETPYLYAKTGSLGNNYCLSGYLLTKSGKTLIFSFMNNHFMQPSSEVKERMKRIFEEIRDKY